MIVTIYENIYSKQPAYIPIEKALSRIKNGRSKAIVGQIRSSTDKEKRSSLKTRLPAVCFSGKFGPERKDSTLIEHSGFLVLDFDEVNDLGEYMGNICSVPFIYAAWVSPSGNGVKALVKIADGRKHREHFAALREIFPDADRSGINPSRVCYESFDEHIYVNERAEVFTKIIQSERIEFNETITDDRENFKRLLTWIHNKGNAFAKGERNTFVFKLAGACCRFGIDETVAESLILSECATGNDFTTAECGKAIKSAYRNNKNSYGSASFDRGRFIDKVTRREVEIDQSAATYDAETKPRDVIYGSDVKNTARSIYSSGHLRVLGIGIQELDKLFKSKRGELTGLAGIGNYGKSTFFKWYLLMRVLLYGEKFASFSPEDLSEDYYFDLVEMLLGCDCTPNNPSRPPIQVWDNAYDFVSSHFFYLSPEDLSPSPQYVKERFLELIIKEKVSGVNIDPFNQLTHDYGKAGGRSDKYLETVLGDFARFAKVNNVYFNIIMHPKQMDKDANGNYKCPDIFDISDGAMWNNKLDNILVYHRPFRQTDPNNPVCEFHSKKIRNQKSVGRPGVMTLEYIRMRRRYEVDGNDYMSRILAGNDLCFAKPVSNYQPKRFEEAPF